MNIEKLYKAQQLNKDIEVMKTKLERIERTMDSKKGLLIKDNLYNDILIDAKHKSVILILAKSLLETELKKLEKEFEEL